MFRLRRRSVAVRAGIVAAVIGVPVLMSLPGASAATSASRSVTSAVSRSVTTSVSATAAAAAEGDTNCVPWPNPTSLGLKCTGTFSGNTAWDPWTRKNLPASDQPWVTISQATNLTDQVVQVTWGNSTPSFDASSYEPNPTAPSDGTVYQVSLLQCNGTNPDAIDGYSKDCYVNRGVGDNNVVNLTTGPPNAVVENTLDTSVPPAVPNGSLQPASSPYSPFWPWQHAANGNTPYAVDGSNKPVPCGSFTNSAGQCTFAGGDPTTWIGHASFHVEAPTPRSAGGFFNCGPSTPCSLVVDPNWGGTPTLNNGIPDYSATSGCATHVWGGGKTGDFVPAGGVSQINNPTYGESQNPAGQGGSTNPGSPTQNNGGCWTADRIVIPLSFAPTSQDCPNTTPQFTAVGSPMMETQMQRWQAGWCTGQAPVHLDYNFEVGESAARLEFLAGTQALAARPDMALVTLPADAAAQQASSRKFTYAPLANSGTGIAYEADDGTTGSQIGRMVLNARLLAKLTTQSYALKYSSCTTSPPQSSFTCDPAVLKNPVSLFDDPEFQTLNGNCLPFGSPANYVCGDHPAGPTWTRDSSDFPSDIAGTGQQASWGGFLPTMLQPDSDMTYDLTGYIASNQDAAGFLGGSIDPWGTHVNNNYLHVSYPIQSISKLDQGWTNTNPQCPTQSGQPNCFGAQVPDESMQASWNFQTDLDTIVRDLLVGQPTASNPHLQCTNGLGSCPTVQSLQVAALASEWIGNRALLSELDLGDMNIFGFPAAELVNAAGKAVAPTQASVEAAVSDMKTNPDGITQFVNNSSTDPKAYPLAMVDYAMVPTCGLSHTEASALANFLTKAATTGQVQGEAPGQLAPGYYPLNAKQKAQTLKAAAEVKAQDCKSTTPDNTIGGHPAPNTSSPQGGNNAPSSSNPGSTAPASSRKNSSSPAAPSGSTAPAKAKTAAFGQKSADSGMAGLLLLLAVIAGALLLIGGPAAWAITATGKWPVVLRWLRPIRERLPALRSWLGWLVVRRT